MNQITGFDLIGKEAVITLLNRVDIANQKLNKIEITAYNYLIEYTEDLWYFGSSECYRLLSLCVEIVENIGQTNNS